MSTQLGCGGAGPNEHIIPPSQLVPVAMLPSGQIVPAGAQDGAGNTTSTHGTKQNCAAAQVEVPHANGPSAGGGKVGESRVASRAASRWVPVSSTAASRCGPASVAGAVATEPQAATRADTTAASIPVRMVER